MDMKEKPKNRTNRLCLYLIYCPRYNNIYYKKKYLKPEKLSLGLINLFKELVGKKKKKVIFIYVYIKKIRFLSPFIYFS